MQYSIFHFIYKHDLLKCKIQIMKVNENLLICCINNNYNFVVNNNNFESKDNIVYK